MPTATESELVTREARLEPSTFDAEKFTIEMVASTGAAYQRRDFEGPYTERLSMDPAAVRLESLVGASFLNSHRKDSLGDVLGIVLKARIEGGKLFATVQLTRRQDAAGYVQDIKDGISRSVSVGYVVHERKVTKDARTGLRSVEVTDWEPKEISAVPVGADPGAKTRSDEMQQQVQTTELTVRQIGELAGLDEAAIADMEGRSLTIDQARTEALAKRKPSQQIQTATVDPVGYDDPAFRRRAMAEGLATRFGGGEPSEAARRYVGSGLGDMARELLQLRGLETTGGGAALITRAMQHSTSDFPELLGEFANKTLKGAYASAPSGVRRVARQTTINDFRNRNILALREMPTLEKINELGEFKRGSRAENREAYRLNTYGKIFGISRQALVNDDLNAFADASRAFGASAANFEDQQLVDLLTSNPAMSDGIALFHEDHSNRNSSVAALSAGNLGAARLAMRLQVGVDGVTPINAQPRFLLVPANLETVAEQVLADLYPATVEAVNPFSGRLDLVVDPRLDAVDDEAWYLFALPAVMPVLEFAYLSSEPGLVVETRAGWDVDGVEIKSRLDFGCGAIDFRGAYLSASE